MCMLVGVIFGWYDDFMGLSGYLDLFDKSTCDQF